MPEPDLQGLATDLDFQLKELWEMLWLMDSTVSGITLEFAAALMRAAWAKGVNDAMKEPARVQALALANGYGFET